MLVKISSGQDWMTKKAAESGEEGQREREIGQEREGVSSGKRRSRQEGTEAGGRGGFV